VITGPAESGQQGAFSDHDQLVIAVRTVEKIIFDSDHPVAAAVQYAAADDVHRIAGSSSVERLGRRCSPIDDEGLVVGVTNADPADVADFAVNSVQPAKDQPLLLGI
jgi:hypothetical protein